ncbi:MAG: ABC transporter ATP-binding protein [Chitinispirillaceae bacterium]|nr:ABC transporter ATP-binding protein [Chitinispirillaceae bacterium]
MTIIELKGVTKTFNAAAVPINAVQGVDLTVDEGEFAAIVGPSGSGKTTLLNLIGGLDEPTSGSIVIGGTDITRLRPGERTRFRLRNIGFVFQSYNLIPVLTAYENTGFIMELQGTLPAERDRRVRQLLDEVGLADRMNSRPSRLSGGQQQRVAVARALAPRPRFILADEPTANLDSHSTETLLDIMARLNKEENTTFLFATHDQRVVKKARRVITVEDGRIASDQRMREEQAAHG